MEHFEGIVHVFRVLVDSRTAEEFNVIIAVESCGERFLNKKNEKKKIDQFLLRTRI